VPEVDLGVASADTMPEVDLGAAEVDDVHRGRVDLDSSESVALALSLET
jgi:hypothetical protein